MWKLLWMDLSYSEAKLRGSQTEHLTVVSAKIEPFHVSLKPENAGRSRRVMRLLKSGK